MGLQLLKDSHWVGPCLRLKLGVQFIQRVIDLLFVLIGWLLMAKLHLACPEPLFQVQILHGSVIGFDYKRFEKDLAVRKICQDLLFHIIRDSFIFLLIVPCWTLMLPAVGAYRIKRFNRHTSIRWSRDSRSLRWVRILETFSFSFVIPLVLHRSTIFLYPSHTSMPSTYYSTNQIYRIHTH